LLNSGAQFDYVGTRLHAGVLCLEHRVRTLIVSIDNRAREIAADTGLPCVARTDRAGLMHWIDGNEKTNLRLPKDEISTWRRQFQLT
jgi:polysaccharide pyruvyl transferase WcaK-like protein